VNTLVMMTPLPIPLHAPERDEPRHAPRDAAQGGAAIKRDETGQKKGFAAEDIREAPEIGMTTVEHSI
jgi:hypothetical protein